MSKRGEGDVADKKGSGKLSQEERLKLAAKLDKELDQFIAGLEKRRNNEAWPEDRWEEEMEKHPFFMSKPLAEGEALPPLIEGLQQLKYDTTDNTPEELAATYKEDGNFNYKHKNYRMAIISYTEGLRRKCSDPDLNAQLYNNRAACHFLLKNFRSCYNDCKRALKLKEFYFKAEMRLAQASYELNLLDECLVICDTMHSSYPSSRSEVEELKDLVLTKKRLEKKNKRREEIRAMHNRLEHERLMRAVKQRGIQFLDEEVDLSDAGSLDSKVHLDENQRLVWPVVFLYPEYKTSDIIKEFHEDNTFMEQLAEVFAEKAEWDVDRKYSARSVRLFYEDSDGNIHSVSKNDTLGVVISHSSFKVDKGTPVFIVLVKGTPAETKFLSSFK